MSENLKWEIRWGEQTITVTSDMVIRSLDKAVSSILKETSENRVIKSDPRLLADWEQSVEILKVLREKFVFAEREEAAKHVNLKVPRKRA
jgi:hypothetical protein